jgi:hypothetical protein
MFVANKKARARYMSQLRDAKRVAGRNNFPNASQKKIIFWNRTKLWCWTEKRDTESRGLAMPLLEIASFARNSDICG